ncbi:MAG: permease [Sulfurimonas sp.]|nr:MAG: permease [Sulfurimonas sp.]
MKNKHFIPLLILAMFLWGGGWSALKILTYSAELEVIIFWRFFIMSISFIPILIFLKQPLNLNKSSLKFVISSSILNIAFMVSSFMGVKYGSAGAGGVIITSISPIMTFLLVYIIFKNKLSLYQVLGIFTGLVGGFILLELNDNSLFLNGSNIYFLLCAIIWAAVTLLSQHSHLHIHPVLYSFYISIIASIITFIYAYSSNLLSIFSLSFEFWIALIYLAILGQSVATTIYFIASAKLGSQITSSYMFLVPIFALFCAWLVLGEEIKAHLLIGGFLSILAVYFINKKH